MAKIKSHLSDDPDELIGNLNRIDNESEENTRDIRRHWRRSIRLFHTGAPDRMDPPPLFQANLINSNIRRGAALLTESKPLLDVRPRKEGLGKTAHILREVIHAIWDEQNVGMKLEDCVLMSKVMQSAFVSVLWDSAANYGLGGVTIDALDPRVVGVDPMIRYPRDLDYAQYVWVDTIVPFHTAQANFPHVADEMRPTDIVSLVGDDDKDGNNAPVRGGVARLLRRARGKEKQTRAVPRIVLRTYWVIDPATDEDGKPLYPNGRVIVRARDQDVICNRTDTGSGWKPGQVNPYYDGCQPLVWLDNAPDLDSAWGRDELDAIRFLQHSINKLGNVGVKTTLQNAVPITVVDQNAIPPESINFLRSMDHWVIEKMAGRSWERGAPQVQLQSITGFMAFLQGLMDNIEGLSDSAGSIGTTRGRAEVRSPAMLEGLQSAAQVLVRAQARRFESFLERTGQKLISRIFQFMQYDQLMTYVATSGQIQQVRFQRQELQKELLELALNELKSPPPPAEDDESLRSEAGGAIVLNKPAIHPSRDMDADRILEIVKGAWRQFRFSVEPFSSLSANRQARAAQRMQLAQAAMIPNYMALEELGYHNPKELTLEALEEAKLRQQIGLQPQQQQGQQKKGAKK